MKSPAADVPAGASASSTRRRRHAGLTLFLFATRKLADLYCGLRYSIRFCRLGQWWNAARCLRSILDDPRPRAPRDRRFYERYLRVQDARRRVPTRWIVSAVIEGVARPDKVIWVAAADLTWKTKLPWTLYFNDILPGDWDLQVRLVDGTNKHRSVAQHFRDGVPWERTDIFVNRYAKHIARGLRPRGARTLDELREFYERHIDPLHESIRRRGFVLAAHRDGTVDIPHVHVARDGRLLLGDNGNHRLAIARLVNVRRIPCFVRARHLEWQRVRTLVARHGPDRCWRFVDPALATHPDLADLLAR